MKDIQALEAELQRARTECRQLRLENDRLRQENARLRGRLDAPAGTFPGPVQLRLPTSSSEQPVTHGSSPAEKIDLFRRLFHGREDVYAVRWEYSDGRSGYSPASRSRAERERGIFLPLTDEAIRDHLEGRQTIGAYPMLRDETCWFLAADFDKKYWQEDVAAFLAACDALRIPAALERSRSGNGGHIWIFFETPVPAIQARRLGCTLLTWAIEERHQIGLDSYDRLFPNQDTLPKGGFGNLIALPLQGGPRRHGNTVFLDGSFEPYPDQWAFLSGIVRMHPADVDALVAAAMRTGSVLGVRPSFIDGEEQEGPWTLPPSGKRAEQPIIGSFPSSTRVTLANQVYIDRDGLPPPMISRLWRLAAFQNPEFYRAQALRLSTFGKARVISCAEEFERHIALPRGCLDDARDLLETHAVRVDVVDERQPGEEIDVAFHGELSPPQQQAVDAVLEHDIGVLCAPTAFGKTVAAAWLIAARRVNTLVLVHRRHLLDQWRDRLARFLDLPPAAIGQLGGGRHQPSGQIDIALIQSLSHAGSVDDIVARYGHVVVDECHHIPAISFEWVLRVAKARFVLGLTATPVRKDGHHPIVIMQCGPVRFRVTPREEAAARPFHQVVIPRPTDFRLPDGADALSIQEIYGALAKDERRNDLICADLLDATQEGRTPLLLTERTEHLDELARRLNDRVRNLIVLRGGMGTKKRRAALEQLQATPDGEPLVLLATGRYAGEGFDDARLDTLLLAMPVSWQGIVRQYAGRLNRLHPAKRDVRIYDYVDSEAPPLERMYKKRLKAYRSMGYVIQPAPATGGTFQIRDQPA